MIKIKDRLNKILSDATGQPVKKKWKLIPTATSIWTKEAKKYGMIDSVLKEKKRKIIRIFTQFFLTKLLPVISSGALQSQKFQNCRGAMSDKVPNVSLYFEQPLPAQRRGRFKSWPMREKTERGLRNVRFCFSPEIFVNFSSALPWSEVMSVTPPSSKTLEEILPRTRPLFSMALAVASRLPYGRPYRHWRN